MDNNSVNNNVTPVQPATTPVAAQAPSNLNAMNKDGLQNKKLSQEIQSSVETGTKSSNFFSSFYNKVKGSTKKKPKEEAIDAEKIMNETIKNTSQVQGNEQTEAFDRYAGKKRITFKYTVKNSYGEELNSLFDAYDIDEVKQYLNSEGYEIVSIVPRKSYEQDLTPAKINNAELSFILTQLSTYIVAGIPLVDSVRILAKQTQVPSKRKIYERLVFDLVTGDNFSTALEKQGDTFPRLLVNMIKTSEMTGDLPTVLNEMADYYTSVEQTRKDVQSALIYPAFIMVFAVAVLVFILIKVVPSFVGMYADAGADLPKITQITLSVSDFLVAYWYYLLGGLILVFGVYFYCFKNIKSFRRSMQTFFMKLPIVGNMIIYSEVTNFTRTFASLLNHSVNITESMKILSNITNNEIYKEIIANTMLTLSRGGKISESFRGHWAFPIVAYEMLVTGESTGQLGSMMEKVSTHFDNLHRNAVNTMKSMIEPLTIVFLAVAVGFILLSIVVPMFDVYNTVQ